MLGLTDVGSQNSAQSVQLQRVRSRGNEVPMYNVYRQKRILENNQKLSG